jgi:hypothetical protein
MSLLLPDNLNRSAKQMFEYLCDSKEFRLTRSACDPKTFGNIQVTAVCDEFGVEYRLDRGDESVFVVVEGTEYLVEDALRLVGDATGVGAQARDEEAWLCSHVDTLKESFHKDRLLASKQVLEQSRRERLHRMFPGAVVED